MICDSFAGDMRMIERIDIPENVLVTGFLPAHKVNPIVDVSVIHGGRIPVMNARLSDTPGIVI